MGRTRRFIMLDDTVWEETRRRAVREGTTAAALVELALRRLLNGTDGAVPVVPVVSGAAGPGGFESRGVSSVPASAGVGAGVGDGLVRGVDAGADERIRGRGEGADRVGASGPAAGVKARLERAVEGVAPGTVVHLDAKALAVPPAVAMPVGTVDPDLGF